MNGIDNRGLGPIRPVGPVDRIAPLDESSTKERSSKRRKGCKKRDGPLPTEYCECTCGASTNVREGLAEVYE